MITLATTVLLRYNAIVSKIQVKATIAAKTPSTAVQGVFSSRNTAISSLGRLAFVLSVLCKFLSFVASCIVYSSRM